MIDTFDEYRKLPAPPGVDEIDLFFLDDRRLLDVDDELFEVMESRIAAFANKIESYRSVLEHAAFNLQHDVVITLRTQQTQLRRFETQSSRMRALFYVLGGAGLLLVVVGEWRNAHRDRAVPPVAQPHITGLFLTTLATAILGLVAARRRDWLRWAAVDS